MGSKKLWFRAKNYGWGWTPITWEGWLVTLVFFLLAVGDFLKIDSMSHSVSDTLMNFFYRIFFLIGGLVVICYLKGEKPEWRWKGKKIKL